MKSSAFSLALLLLAAYAAVVAAEATLGNTPDMEELLQALAKQGRDRSPTANKSEAVALSEIELLENGIGNTNTGTCEISLFNEYEIPLTVCASIIKINLESPSISIPGGGGCQCGGGGSARGFYFQQYGDVSLAVSGDTETGFLIRTSKGVELGASVPLGSCNSCPQGTYQPEAAFNCEGLDSCKFCPAGYVPSKFQVRGQEGAAECFKCEPGTYSAGNGAVGVVHSDENSNLAICHECEAGTFAPNAGAAECTLCAPGTFQGAAGASSCTLCSTGTFSNGGAESCTDCKAGTFTANEGSEECHKCEPGTFQGAAGASSCTLCSTGTFSNGGGAESCTECNPGTFTSNEASEECHKCEPGTAQPYPGQDSCFVCEPGTFTSASGAQACEPCRPGTFAPNFGSDGCELCPKGTFTNRFGQVECTKCPKWSTSEGSTSCTDSEKFDEALEDKAAEGQYKYDE